MAQLVKITAYTKDDVPFELSVETKGKKRVGTADTGGEKEGSIWVTTGVRVEARGPRDSEGKRIVEIARKAVTNVMGTPPIVMVGTISGLITLEWDGKSKMDEDEITQGLVREVGEASYLAGVGFPQPIKPPAGELVWFCRACLDGPWTEERLATEHIRAFPSHGIRHARLGVLERMRRDREEGLEKYWVCETDGQGPWIDQNRANVHSKLNPGHVVKQIGKNQLETWRQGASKSS